MNSYTKIILGITVVAAAGVAVGIMLPPEKRSDLQKKMKNGAKKWITDFSASFPNSSNSGTPLRLTMEEDQQELTSELMDLDMFELQFPKRKS